MSTWAACSQLHGQCKTCIDKLVMVICFKLFQSQHTHMLVVNQDFQWTWSSRPSSTAVSRSNSRRASSAGINDEL